MHHEEKRNTYHPHGASPGTRVLAVLLAAFLVLTLLSQVIVFAGAIDQETIDGMKEQQTAMEEQIAACSEQIAELETQANSAVARYEAITEEIDCLNEQIDLSEALLEQYREETAQEELNYNNAQLRIEKLTEEYTAAVRAMETQGVSAYWSALLNSNSIVEFVQTLNDLQSVTEAQQRVIAEMEEARADAEAAENQLSTLAAQQEDAQALLQTQRKQDEESLAALDEVIAEISANQTVYATQMSALQSSKDSLEDDILEAETQLAIEQEAARKAAEEAARKAAEEEAARKAAEEEAARKAAEEEAARIAAEEEAARKAAEEEAARIAAEEAAREADDEQEYEAPAAEEPDEDEDDAGSSTSCTGDDVVAYALQFVGNPYVWGGTSLTNGCDCSGFVMKVYEHFGYSLPHYSGSQARCGIGVSYSDAQPGDIICYENHVGIYIGDGQMVNAYDEEHGIIICAVSTSKLTAVRRLIY